MLKPVFYEEKADSKKTQDATQGGMKYDTGHPNKALLLVATRNLALTHHLDVQDTVGNWLYVGL